MELFIDRISSPIGQIRLVWEFDAVRALDFEDYDARMRRLLGVHYGSYELIERRAPAALRGPIDAYFEGDLTAIESIPVKSSGTAFQQQTWAALREIPAGRTISYGELASRIGRPKASRAVGLANGSNPIGIVVPCHRVIGANGSLTGYGGGIDRKRWLLAHEQRSLLT